MFTSYIATVKTSHGIEKFEFSAKRIDDPRNYKGKAKDIARENFGEYRTVKVLNIHEVK